MKYRKKPVVVEAFRFQIDAYMPDWFSLLQMRNTIVTYSDGTCKIKTLEGIMMADKGDYIIKGVQGEVYPCKPGIFKETYTLVADTSLNFGQAIQLLKEGKKLARKGWNGKNMFVVYQKGYPDGIPSNKQTAEAWGINEGDLFKVEPYLQIRMANGSHAMWVPSINDTLAEDWEVMNKEIAE